MFKLDIKKGEAQSPLLTLQNFNLSICQTLMPLNKFSSKLLVQIICFPLFFYLVLFMSF